MRKLRVPALALTLASAGCADDSDGAADGYTYEAETVSLEEDWVVAADEVVKVGPGTVFEVADDVTVRVLGTLELEGTAEAPVRFVGGGEPSAWQGILLEDGATLTALHGEVSDALYAVRALAGSTLTMQDSWLYNSFKAAVVETDASFEGVVFDAAPSLGFAITEEVSLDDPNGTVTVMEASPSFTECAFNGASALNDVVRVGGESSPMFEHVVFRDAHCGIHASGAENNSPYVRAAVFENLAYGLMAYTAKPIVEDSVFTNNGYDVGLCVGATEDNVPELSNNFYSDGAPSLDAGCFSIGTDDPSPAAEADPEAGAGDL